MAKSASTDRYLVTVPVATMPADRHQLDRKFEAALQHHNAVLGQLLRRHGPRGVTVAGRPRRPRETPPSGGGCNDAVCADVGLSERALARSAMDQLPRVKRICGPRTAPG